MTLLAVSEVTSWPTAAIAIAAIAFATIVISVAIWQIFGTGRTAIASHRDQEYQKLVDELTTVQQRTTEALEQANDALGQLRTQIAGLEHDVKEVDRVLKAVE